MLDLYPMISALLNNIIVAVMLIDLVILDVLTGDVVDRELLSSIIGSARNLIRNMISKAQRLI